MTNLKSFMMSLAATTVSIVLTFGTTAIVNHKKKNNEKRAMVMMIMYDMRETLKEVEKCDENLNAFFDSQVDLIAHPDKFEKGYAELVSHIPTFDYTTTAENIFRSNIETINTLGNILFVEAASSFYDYRATYKDAVVSDFQKQACDAIVSYDRLYHFSSANYPFYSHTYLLRMNDNFEQCKLMMKVKDKDLEAYSIKQQKLQAKTSGESQEYETLLRDMRQRNDRLQNAREEAKKAH